MKTLTIQMWKRIITKQNNLVKNVKKLNIFLAACPNDPFADNCPPQCNIIADDNDCTLCICAKTVSDGFSSYSKVSVSGDIIKKLKIFNLQVWIGLENPKKENRLIY